MGLAEKAFSEWYKLMVAAGCALVIAALTAKNQPLLLIALGMVFAWFGEFINHPFITAIEDAGLMSRVYSGRVRRNKVVGWILVVIGCGLVAIGLCRIIVTA